MSHHVELKYAVRTDTGMVRAQNEDAVELRPAHGVVVLADGMGGYRAGEVASGIATQVVADLLEKGLTDFEWSIAAERSERLVRMMTAAVEQANLSIYEQARRNPQQFAGMGTTLVSTIFHHDRLVIAHVGDSRAYRFRDNLLEQITRDHSQVQEQVDAGLLSKEEARFAPNRNLVTRAMGIDALVDVEVHEFAIKAGDLYLLCSDGLCDMLEDAEIAQLLEWLGSSIDTAAEALVKRANALGGLDNISVALIHVESTSPDNPGILGRMLDWVR